MLTNPTEFAAFLIGIFTIIYVLFSVLVAVVAEERGRSPIGYFLLSLFCISPFLTILYLYILGETADHRKLRLLDEAQYIKNHIDK